MFALLTHAFGLAAGKSSSYRKNLEFIAKDIGKDLIPFLKAEYLVRGLTPEERKKPKQLLEDYEDGLSKK